MCFESGNLFAINNTFLIYLPTLTKYICILYNVRIAAIGYILRNVKWPSMAWFNLMSQYFCDMVEESNENDR